MKSLIPLLLLIIPHSLQAQVALDSLQQEWVQALKSGNSTSSFYWDDRSLTFSKITTFDAESVTQLFSSEGSLGIKHYQHWKTYEHDPSRYVTLGLLSTTADSILLLTGWRDVEGSWKKEIDVILTPESTDYPVSESLDRTLDQRRKTWVRLANEHDPKTHIEALYSAGATYFGNGYKSEGREEIAERYFYMENPNYQVDLKKEQLWQISESRVLELGRYFTGAERVGNGGLYVILWEYKDDEWMIELDFNF